MSDNNDLGKQGQELAQNITQIAELSSKIWRQFLQGQVNKQDEPTDVAPMLGEMAKVLWADVSQNSDSMAKYWQGQQALWQSALAKWTEGEAVDIPELPPEGKRFGHKAWSENTLFEFIKRSYLLTSQWMQDAVADADDLSDHDRKKLAFFTRNFVEGVNPANFFALNPEVLEATAEQNGENLVRGLNMMLADLTRGKGELLIRQTDMDAFEVGRDMAVTPGKVIWQNNVLQLIQYAPSTEQVHAKPLLMIPPWINKYYVLDLNQNKSMMKWLVSMGYTVFIISWVNPDSAQKDETWDSYLDAVSDVIDKVLAETGQKSVNLTGYCIGGTLMGTFLALKDKRVASATFLTTLLDFTEGGELQLMVDEDAIRQVDAMMADGYLPAQNMAKAFNMLRSNDLIWSYVVNNYMLGKEPFPFDLLYWNSDSTAMPAKVHHFYLEQFYLNNTFAKGDLVVQDRPVVPADISVPVYQVATQEDHIAPPQSVYDGARMLSNAKLRFVLAGSGHIAGVVNPPAAQKYRYWAANGVEAENLNDWMEAADETAGSWWVDWDKWLKRRSGKWVAAREPGIVGGIIEDAPGGYVKQRFDQR